jgi:hypothetical protein
MRVWLVAANTALILLLSATACGQSPAQHPPAREENLSETIINPIAFLMRFTAENKYSPSLWNSHGEENEVEGTFVVPFEAFAKQNLGRIKVFFETSSSDGTHGLSEIQIFDLVLSQRSWGTLGAGISIQLNSESAKSLGTVAPGPAVGAVVKHEKWKYGLFNQNFLSDTLAQTTLQPILAYAFDKKWSAEIGDAQYTYDWKKHHVTSIPLSGQLNRIVSFENQNIHLFFRAQYDLKNESGSDKWTLAAGFSLILPQ